MEDITARAERLGKALQSKQYAEVVDATYPKLVEMGGGREKLLADLKAVMDRTGVEMMSFKAEKPGATVGTGRDLAMIVPTTVEMRVNDSTTILQKGYLLAISSDGGSSWAFIDGSALTPEIIKSLLPQSLHGIQLPTMK